MCADSKSGASLGAAPPIFRHAFARHWKTSVRYYGLRRTLTQIAEAAYRFGRELLPDRRKVQYGDLDYDFDHSVDTTRANVSFRAQLIAALTSHQYFPSEPWLFDEMMQALTSALSIQQSAVGRDSAGHAELQEFTFVDLGSGKGRCLLMAAPYGFKKIIGVEFMPEWHRVAEENICKYAQKCAVENRPAAALESHCMDARDFEFPAGPLVVYLFNPFPEPVLAAVLERLRRSLGRNPKPMFLVYRFPEFEPLLQKCDWLEKIAATEQWEVYRYLPSGASNSCSTKTF
jgi:SAM-dependent methyltransferase